MPASRGSNNNKSNYRILDGLYAAATKSTSTHKHRISSQPNHSSVSQMVPSVTRVSGMATDEVALIFEFMTVLCFPSTDEISPRTFLCLKLRQLHGHAAGLPLGHREEDSEAVRMSHAR